MSGERCSSPNFLRGSCGLKCFLYASPGPQPKCYSTLQLHSHLVSQGEPSTLPDGHSKWGVPVWCLSPSPHPELPCAVYLTHFWSIRKCSILPRVWGYCPILLSLCPSLSAVTLMVLSHPPGLCPALPVRHGSFPKESQRGLSFPSMRSTQHWVMEGLGRAVHVKRKDHGLSGWGRPQKPEKSGGVT